MASTNGKAIEPRVGRDTPDPGSPKAARVALVLMLVLVGAVMFLQQLGASGAGAASPPTNISAPVGIDPFASTARMMIKFATLFDTLGTTGGSANAAQVNAEKAKLVDQVDAGVTNDVDRFRAALTRGFMLGGTEGEAALDTLALASPTYEGVETDIADARAVLAANKEAISSDQQRRLLDRHGYFAQLLFATSEPTGSPARDALTAGAGMLIVLAVALGLLLLLVLLASLTCFTIGLVRISSGRIRPAFRAPEPGGSVFLETVAVLAAGFLTLKVVMAILEFATSGAGAGRETFLMLFAMALQWFLALVIFWPRLRGVPMKEMRRRMGLHRGQGVMKEIRAGIFAYFATLPIVMVAVVISLLLILGRAFVQGQAGQNAAPPENPIVDVIANGSWFTLVMLYLLATLWAPLVEETVFRGCLFRHLRSRLGLILSAILSAFVFGVMHGYEFMLLGPVMAIGFNFALMREWRDSLIAPMFAHAMHNGTVLIIAIVAMQQVALPPAP